MNTNINRIILIVFGLFSISSICSTGEINRNNFRERGAQVIRRPARIQVSDIRSSEILLKPLEPNESRLVYVDAEQEVSECVFSLVLAGTLSDTASYVEVNFEVHVRRRDKDTLIASVNRATNLAELETALRQATNVYSISSIQLVCNQTGRLFEDSTLTIMENDRIVTGLSGLVSVIKVIGSYSGFNTDKHSINAISRRFQDAGFIVSYT